MNISGAVHAGVLMSEVTVAMVAPVSSFEEPKSEILSTLPSMRTLSDLKSLWATFFECRYFIPRHSCSEKSSCFAGSIIWLPDIVSSSPRNDPSGT